MRLTSARRSMWIRITDFILRRGDPPDDDLIYLSRKEVRDLLERRAQAELGLSAEEFLAAVDNGQLRDSPVAQHLLLIAGERSR
jgi:hypothetical protein